MAAGSYCYVFLMPDQRKSLFRSAIEILGSNLGAVGLNAIAHFLLAAALPATLYGTIVFYLLLLNFLTMGAMYGFQSVASHQLPRLSAQGAGREINTLINEIILYVCIFSMLLVLALWILNGFIYPLPVAHSTAILPWFFLAVPCWALMRIYASINLTRGATISSAFPENTLQAIALVAVLGIDSLPHMSLTALHYVAGLSLASLAGTLWFTLQMKKYFTEFSWLKPKLNGLLGSYNHLALPFFLFSVFQTGLQRFDLILIGVLADPQILAIYSITLKIAQLATFPSMAVKTALAPKLSGLFESKDLRSLKSVLMGSTFALAGITLVAGLIILLTAPLIFSILGPGYTGGTGLLAILLIVEFIVAVFTPIKIAGLMGDGQKELTLIFGAGFIASALLNLLLVPLYGVYASAFIRLGLFTILHAGLLYLWFMHSKTPNFTKSVEQTPI